MYAVEEICTSSATTQTITATTAARPSIRVPTCSVTPPIGDQSTAVSCTRAGALSTAASAATATPSAPPVPAIAGTAGPPGSTLAVAGPTTAAMAGNAGSSQTQWVIRPRPQRVAGRSRPGP